MCESVRLFPRCIVVLYRCSQESDFQDQRSTTGSVLAPHSASKLFTLRRRTGLISKRRAV